MSLFTELSLTEQASLSGGTDTPPKAKNPKTVSRIVLIVAGAGGGAGSGGSVGGNSGTATGGDGIFVSL